MKENSAGLNLDFKQVIYSLSDALDFVGIDEVHHGKRVGLMARECAISMGWGEAEVNLIFEIGLLHDCGVSSTSVHKHLINEFDWSESQVHCEIGYELLHRYKPFVPMALPVKYHHTHWKVLKNMDLDPRVKLYANLIYLADRIDVLCAEHYKKDILVSRDTIRHVIVEKEKEFFSPELVEAFWAVAEKPAFWFSLSPEHIVFYMSELRKKPEIRKISFNDLKKVALIFSQIVDAKSPFTVEHSEAVAQLARFIASKAGLDSATQDKIEIAGLLHDLGKLKIPDEILDKGGKLEPAERATIEEHSFETFEILSKITGLEDVARWAAFHHERADGKGYPFQIPGNTLEAEARIVAVADVFQALNQNRPYRSAMPVNQSLQIIGDMVKEGCLDRDVVNLLLEYKEECYEIAVNPDYVFN